MAGYAQRDLVNEGRDVGVYEFMMDEEPGGESGLNRKYQGRSGWAYLDQPSNQ